MISGLRGLAAVMDEERLGSILRAAVPSISFGGQFLRTVPPPQPQASLMVPARGASEGECSVTCSFSPPLLDEMVGDWEPQTV